MSTHKHFERICCVVLAVCLLLTVAFMNAEAFGIEAADTEMGYESRLFDISRVHTLDIVMDDWDSFIQTCENEEYAACNVVIDGESFKSVGIRAKGNTSLSNVSAMDSDRYSFKIEFDQYDSTKNYHGLDKLSLNNLIQDNTLMKDFLVYQMMNAFGASAPLCSYVYITVNGEDWGLYLAVEGVEDSFLQRNYGNDYGDLYKPDSMSFGGGRGNGRDFNMEDFDFSFDTGDTGEDSANTFPGGFDPSAMGGQMQGGFDPSAMGGRGGGRGQMGGFTMPSIDEETLRAALEEQGIDPSILDDVDLENLTMETIQELMEKLGDVDLQTLMMSVMSDSFGGMDFGNMDFGDMDMGGFSMGSSDVKLQYIDDDPESYSNIFDSAKTDVTDADKARLIDSLQTLSTFEDVESAVDIDATLRYFVVHNFVVNGDSYTGSMIHNYYLYEEDGQLSMIPWDYNLAFGTFMGNQATSSVNDPIDSPTSGSNEDRPMVGWIFSDEEYTQLYHEYFDEFLATCFDSGWFEQIVTQTADLIAPYVEKDPSKFCTYEEFQTGAAAIQEFCLLRAQSVRGQLDGTIPSTSEGQSADSSTLIDASSLNLSDMGTMGNMMGGGGRGGFGGGGGMTFPGQSENGSMTMPQMPGGSQSAQPGTQGGTQPEQGAAPDGTTGATSQSAGMNRIPGGFAPTNTSAMTGSAPTQNGGMQDAMPQMPQGGMPEGFDMSSLPEGVDPENMPEGFDAGSMPEGFTGGDFQQGMQQPNQSGESETADGSGDATSGTAGMTGMRPAMNVSMNLDGLGSEAVLMLASLAVLAVGLIVAFTYKRR